MPNFKRLKDIAVALKPRQQTGKCFHVTFIYDKSKLLSIGVNNYNRLKNRFSTHNDRHNLGLHSEFAAILKLGLDDCNKLTFINVRIDNNGKLAMSKPCCNCQMLLQQVGYKKLWYWDEGWVCVLS